MTRSAASLRSRMAGLDNRLRKAADDARNPNLPRSSLENGLDGFVALDRGEIDQETETEAGIRVARAKAFSNKGIEPMGADMLAGRLRRRDREMDNRRSCAECVHFYIGGCQRHREPFGGGGVEVLHRCQGFELSPACSPARLEPREIAAQAPKRRDGYHAWPHQRIVGGGQLAPDKPYGNAAIGQSLQPSIVDKGALSER